MFPWVDVGVSTVTDGAHGFTRSSAQGSSSICCITHFVSQPLGLRVRIFGVYRVKGLGGVGFGFMHVCHSRQPMGTSSQAHISLFKNHTKHGACLFCSCPCFTVKLPAQGS